MLDQIIINNKASFDDFRASVASRKANAPTKKSIKQTVPHSNKTYDFSAINGEVYWEERELEYIFEIVAPTPAKLENAKMLFSNWVMNVTEADLYDPFIEDYHFTDCTFKSISYEDDESVEKSTITVIFTAYPYKLSNEEKTYKISVPVASKKSIDVVNNSAHRIMPIFESNTDATIKLNDTTFAITTGEFSSSGIMLQIGANSLEVQNIGDTELTLIVRFFEEVF